MTAKPHRIAPARRSSTKALAAFSASAQRMCEKSWGSAWWGRAVQPNHGSSPGQPLEAPALAGKSGAGRSPAAGVEGVAGAPRGLEGHVVLVVEEPGVVFRGIVVIFTGWILLRGQDRHDRARQLLVDARRLGKRCERHLV